MRIEFLLEEASMVNFLRIILPRILPPEYKIDENCFLRPHQGKSDLQKSIPKKVRTFSSASWGETVKIVIIQDQDTNDCKELKSQLSKLCRSNGNVPCLIRIACRELESWYLGDMEAIEKVYNRFKASTYKDKSRFRNPDTCHASAELSKLIDSFQKGFASRNIPIYMNLEMNKSKSFNSFKDGLKKFLT